MQVRLYFYFSVYVFVYVFTCARVRPGVIACAPESVRRRPRVLYHRLTLI